MESELKQGEFFNGFLIRKRGQENAENLADSILSRESIEDLMHDFENESVGLDQMKELQSTLADRRQGGEISDDRKRALDRLEEARFKMKGSLPHTRDPEDTTSSQQSGVGKLKGWIPHKR
ncbi:MAG: hypothetical protein ACC618_00740 [Patescibacteria group bacterium]